MLGNMECRLSPHFAIVSANATLWHMVADDPEWTKQLFLERFKADQAHELELDRILATYELRFFQLAGLLNAAAVTLFLSFFGSTIGKLHADRGLLVGASIAWLAGLMLSIWAGIIAYRAQEAFMRHVRMGRNAAGLKVAGEQYRAVHNLTPADTATTIDERAHETYQQALADWHRARLIGIICIGFFGLGVAIALRIIWTTGTI